MNMASRLGGAAVLVGLLAPVLGLAQAPGLANEDGARAIGEAVRDWLARQAGNMVDLSTLALRVLPEGDGYRLELPFGGNYFNDALVLGDGAAAATVKPLDGGRWQIVNAALPSRLRAEMRNFKDGAPMTMSIAIDSQQTTGIYDPSLATPSTFNATFTGYTAETESASGTQSSRIGKVTSRSEWQPTVPGRATVQGDTTLEDYSSSSPLPGGEVARVTIGRMSGATRIENLDIDGLGALLRSAFELGAAAKAQAQAQAADNSADAKVARPEDKALATKLLGQVFAMMDALQTDYSYENIQVDGGQMFSGSLRRFALGISTGAPDGKMGVKLRLGLEGLESPMIPPGPWVEFVPHQVSLSPSISGVPKEALLALLRRAINEEGDGVGADAMALIADNPLALAIEDLLVDLGPLRLRGSGNLEVSSPDDAAGEAELRATGLDALIRRANQVPELKMAAPVLIFLKGIGKQEGKEMVWHITYADKKMTVNDTDMSDMMPSK